MTSFGAWRQRLFRTKTVFEESQQRDASSRLDRVLGVADLTALGVGSTLGIGIYVLAGQVAKTQAGPAVILSFLIAAVASVLAGVCYAEFGGRVPNCGSAYIYCYVCIGEGFAFLMGWTLLLEFALGTSSVAQGYGGYIDQLMGSPIKTYFSKKMALNVPYLSAYPDFLAVSLIAILTVILCLGAKQSTRFNNIFAVGNLLVVAYCITCGAFKADTRNWAVNLASLPPAYAKEAGAGGFLPFGLSGVVAGAATCFFGFQGFDAIPAASEEARDPQRSIPLAICLCLLIVFLAYFGTAAVLTLMVPYYLQDPNVPLPHAFRVVGWPSAAWIISIGTLCGLSTSLTGSLFPLPRIFFAMAKDGLLFRWLGRVHPWTKTPLFATIVSGTWAAIMAAIFAFEDLVSLMALATLIAFGLVAACVIVLRYQVDPNQAFDQNSETAGLLAGPVSPSTGPLSLVLLPPAYNNYKWKHLLSGRLTQPSPQTSALVTASVCIFGVLATGFSFCAKVWAQNLKSLECVPLAVTCLTGVAMLLPLYCIYLMPQSNTTLPFKVSAVPFLPAFSILINIYLMLNIPAYTWVQYAAYMMIGLVLYITYGWRNSSEEYKSKGLSAPDVTPDSSIAQL